jgi:hypothetical protein
MHRVGRDKLTYIDFKKYKITPTDMVVYQFGEVDCRCHIKKQMDKGRSLSEIVENLVTPYLESIEQNVREIKIALPHKVPTKQRFNMQFLNANDDGWMDSADSPNSDPDIIVCCIPPAMNKEKTIPVDFGSFPFMGSNAERAMYTEKMNEVLQQGCAARGFLFFDYYWDFIDASDPSCNMLEVAISDGICHIKQNGKLLEKFRGFISNM